MLTKSKAFYKLLIEHSFNTKKVKKLIQTDKRLNQDERTILSCFLLMRENKNQEALAMIEVVKKQSDPLVESMRFFLLGSLLNHLGMQDKSMIKLTASYDHLPKGHDSHLEFVILLNLYIINVNYRSIKNAGHFIQQMDQIKNLNDEDQLTLMKCHFNFSTLTGDLKQAAQFYKELDAKKDLFKPHTLISYYFDVWDYAIVAKDFKLCEEILEKIKEQRVYSLTQNYNYMKILLNHYLHDQPVFINEQIFRGFPKLLNELRCIRYLETNKLSEASQTWDAMRQFAPHAFKEHFHYQGQASILSLCLEKHETKIKNYQPKNIKRDVNRPIPEGIKVLLEQNAHLTKDELFRALFNRDPDSKDDYARLSREIYKCKSMFQLNIDTKKGLVALKKSA
jgi:hypothetical protein